MNDKEIQWREDEWKDEWEGNNVERMNDKDEWQGNNIEKNEWKDEWEGNNVERMNNKNLM